MSAPILQVTNVLLQDEEKIDGNPLPPPNNSNEPTDTNKNRIHIHTVDNVQHKDDGNNNNQQKVDNSNNNNDNNNADIRDNDISTIDNVNPSYTFDDDDDDDDLEPKKKDPSTNNDNNPIINIPPLKSTRKRLHVRPNEQHKANNQKIDSNDNHNKSKSNDDDLKSKNDNNKDNNPPNPIITTDIILPAKSTRKRSRKVYDISNDQIKSLSPKKKKIRLSSNTEAKAIIGPVLIILRGFPGSGKSTLTSSIIKYYGSANCISCSYDKYHWKNGVFKFDKSIHGETKIKCHNEITQSMKNNVRVVIIDNGNFELWEYSKYVKLANKYGYKILVAQINYQTKSIPYKQHLNHMNNNKYVDECLLCNFQEKRCKMKIPNYSMKLFINKWEYDKYAYNVEPKLKEHEFWSNDELKLILSNMKDANYYDYPEDNWNKNNNNNRKNWNNSNGYGNNNNWHNSNTYGYNNNRSRNRGYRRINNYNNYSRYNNRSRYNNY